MAQPQNPIAVDPVVQTDNPTLEQLNSFFENDRFASEAARCRIVEGRRGFSVVEMEVGEVHLNAQGHVMGGAIFTLGRLRPWRWPPVTAAGRA